MSDPDLAPRNVVRAGYDRIGPRYLRWRKADLGTTWALDRAGNVMLAGARALDLGCGAGSPVTHALAEKDWVVGVDLSAEQLSIARDSGLGGRLIQADMTEVLFKARSFKLVVAFYSFNHVPREHLGILLRRIESWLEKGGILIASFATNDDPGTIEENWLGEPMYFSGFEVSKTFELLRDAGFEVVEQEVISQQEHGHTVSFLWVVAARGNDPVRLVPHRKEWADIFRLHRQTLLNIHGDGSVIEHIGSTAIPGILAKPIVDIAVGLEEVAASTLMVQEMEQAGYTYYGERGISGRELFAKRSPTTVHVHVVRLGGEHWLRYIAFRDSLRADQTKARAYESLKRDLAERFAEDRVSYTAGKSDFIANILNN